MSKHSLTLNFINFWRVFVVVWCDTSRRRDVWCVMVCIVLYLIWDHLPLTLIWSMLNGCVNFLDKIYGLLPSRTPPIPKPCLLRPWPLLWPTLLLPPLQIPLTLLLRHDRNPVPRPCLELRTPSLLPPRIKTQDTKKDRAPTDSSSPDAMGGVIFVGGVTGEYVSYQETMANVPTPVPPRLPRPMRNMEPGTIEL